MQTRLGRNIPLTAAAALTFGGCVGSEVDPSPPTNEDLAALGRQFFEAMCEKLQTCAPDAAPFENVEACLAYYAADYTPSAFEEDARDAPDPEGCRFATAHYAECIIDFYANLSCDQLTDDTDEFDLPCPAEARDVDFFCGSGADAPEGVYGDL